MTVLTHEVLIAAPRQLVWDTLSTLDLLATYDPGTKTSALFGEQSSGVGAERRCEVSGGWFVERVTAWEPGKTLAFALVSCSFPVTALRHDYALSESEGSTLVTQVMTYQLKYGPVGRAMDAVILRRQWDRGIRAFLAGLKGHVETLRPPTPGD